MPRPVLYLSSWGQSPYDVQNLDFATPCRVKQGHASELEPETYWDNLRIPPMSPDIMMIIIFDVRLTDIDAELLRLVYTHTRPGVKGTLR
jgi:hypothetical protein